MRVCTFRREPINFCMFTSSDPKFFRNENHTMEIEESLCKSINESIDLFKKTKCKKYRIVYIPSTFHVNAPPVKQHVAMEFSPFFFANTLKIRLMFHFYVSLLERR